MVYTELVLLVAPAMPVLNYATLYLKKKMHYKKLVTHIESHASAVRLLKRVENSAI